MTDLKEFYRGYLPTKNKKSTIKFKNKDILTYDQVKDLPEYAGVLNDDTVLIDIDDKDYTIRGRKPSDVMMDIIEDLQLNCRVHESRGGIHVLFKNDGRHKKCLTGKTLACGIPSDIKVGNSSYEVLKIDNKERFVMWDRDEHSSYDIVPKWLTYVSSNDFMNLNEGDGRNQKLFGYILTLQSNGFTKDEARECIRIINKYVLKDPISDKELETILRDESFKKESFYIKGKLQYEKLARFLIAEENIIKINNQLHIYDEGVYTSDLSRIEKKLLNYINNSIKANRNEVINYLEILAESKDVMSPTYVAVNNGILNLSTLTLMEFSPNHVIKNKINVNYNPKAYSEVMDKTLDKICCNNKSLRNLMEEMVGYTLFKRNELRKCFILTGDGKNGKSTLLDIIFLTRLPNFT